jgi:hypothetical protein
MVISKFLLFLAYASSCADAFAVVSRSTASTTRAHSPLNASSDSDIEQVSFANGFRDVVAVSVLSFSLLFPNYALAAQDSVPRLPMDDAALHSSSIRLSATIKTMDFSLPGSYDSLSDPIASGTDELTETIVINSTGSSKKTAAPTGGSSPKEQAEAARAERIAQRKATELAQSQLDEQAAKERDENIKAMRLEKAAKRAAEQAEKEAAASNDVEKFKGAKFLDTSMPTY